MNPISVTVTGRLGDDPHPFTTRSGTDGVELRLAIEIPARGAGDSITRWVKVVAFGLLATRTVASVSKGDRVTVVADDMTAEAWVASASGEPRGRITLRANEIAASMAFDSLRNCQGSRVSSRAARPARSGAARSKLPAPCPVERARRTARRRCPARRICGASRHCCV